MVMIRSVSHTTAVKTKGVDWEQSFNENFNLGINIYIKSAKFLKSCLQGQRRMFLFPIWAA